MEDRLCSDTVVVGIGNTILSDDGAGVHAARRLKEDARLPPGVTIFDGGTLGLELAPFVSEASHILFLDAVDSGEPAGSLSRLTGTDLLSTPRSWSVHQLGIADLIATLSLLATKPQDIVVLGVQPAYTDWGTSLSHKVEKALTPLVDAALEQLRVWHALAKDSTTGSSSRMNPAPDQAKLKFHGEGRP